MQKLLPSFFGPGPTAIGGDGPAMASLIAAIRLLLIRNTSQTTTTVQKQYKNIQIPQHINGETIKV